MTRGFQLLLPGLVLLGAISLWQALVWLLAMPTYLLPGPWEVLQAALRQPEQFALAVQRSGAAALTAFGISLVLGSLAAVLFAQAAVVRWSLYPYAIFLQTVPIVAIAPLIVLWLGSGFWAIVVVAVIISVFPIVINVTTGLLTVEPGLRDLFRLYGASRWQRLRHLHWPGALPGLITGARTSSGLTVVGSIVGEFFAGYGSLDQRGLGYLIRQTSDTFRTPELFAAIACSALLGLALFTLSGLLGRLVLGKWYDKGGG